MESPLQSFWRVILAMVGVIGARLSGAGFAFLTQLVLARAFAPHDVGTAFFAMSVMIFVSIVVTGGYHAIALTYLARFQAFGRLQQVQAFLIAARRDMFLLALIFLLLSPLAFLLPLADGVAKAVLFGVWAAIPVGIVRLNNSAANAQRRFALSYVPDFVVRPGLLLGFLSLLVLFGQTDNIDYVLVSLVLIAIMVAVGQAIILGPDNAFARFPQAPSRDLRPFYRRRSGAMLMVTIVGGATADLVVLLGGMFMPPSQVAVLGVAIRMATLVGFFSLASQQFVLRDLAAARSKGHHGASDAILWRTNLVGGGTMLVSTVLALFFGKSVLALFGPSYVAGYWPMVIFLLAQSVRVMGGMNAQLMALGGHQVRSAALCALAVAVLAVLAAILIPLWGLVGIATAMLGAELVWAIGLAVLTQRLEGRRGDLFAGLYHHRLFTARR